MRDLGWIIKANAEAAGREAGHLCNDAEEAVAALDARVARANWERAEAIEAAQDEEIERFCTRDHAKLIVESPAADLSFLAFNRGRNRARKEG